MKSKILFLAAILYSSLTFSQFTLKGKITYDNSKSISGATIELKIKNIVYSISSKNDGYYQIDNIDSGLYSISVSAVGYLTRTGKINISQDNERDFDLEISSNNLPNVEVIGRYKRDYTSEYSYAATKNLTLNKDVPNSIGTVTKELIADRQAFQLADAVKIVPGVVPSSFYNQYSIRGISQNEEGQIINGMRTRQFYFLQPITSHIERVEVIKGPASSSFASVDPGGSINMVTKKPLSLDRKQVSISAGSFATIRGTLDFTGPLNDTKTLL
jgi:iron complex outermembrane receptor protein